MRISQWALAFLVACALFFVASAVWRAYAPWESGSLSLLMAAGYCFLLALLVRFSYGIHRSVMIIASAAIGLVYVSRLVYLTLAPDSYSFDRLVPMNDEMIRDALLFLAAGTVAFWLGLGVVLRRSALTFTGRPEDAPGFALMTRYWRIILLLAYGALLARMLLRLWVGPFAEEGSSGPGTAGALSFLWVLNLTPSSGLYILVMYPMILLWKGLGHGARLLFLGVILAATIDGYIGGSRGSPFWVVPVWVTVASFVLGNPKIAFKWVVVGFLMLALLGPVWLQAVTTVRASWAYKAAPISYGTLEGSGAGVDLGLGQIGNTASIFTKRMDGFDRLALVMNYRPEVLAPYVTPRTLMNSIADRLLPHWIYDSGQPSLGRLFGLGYQGVSLDRRHAGGWFGFGFFYAYFGWLGAVGLGVLGAGVGALLLLLRRWAILGTLVSLVVLQVIVWQGFLSGNYDSLVANAIIQSVLLVALVGAAILGGANASSATAKIPTRRTSTAGQGRRSGGSPSL
jgi:hypothetical protein